MKLWKFSYFLLIFVVNCREYFRPIAESKDIIPISKAIHEVIEEIYLKNQIQFDVIVSEEPTGILKDLCTKFLMSHFGKFSYHLRNFSEYFVVLERSAVFFVESYIDHDLLHTNSIVHTKNPKPLRFLVFIETCNLNYMKHNLKSMIKMDRLSYISGNLEVFEYLLINDGNFLYFATIEWFTEVACNQPQLKILNSFNKTSQKWDKKLKNYDKFQDFHGCELTLGLNYPGSICWGAFVNFTERTRASEAVGLKPKLFTTLSKKFNFLSVFRTNRRQGPISDVYFDILRLSSFLNGMLHMTASFIEVRDLILTTPGELYSPYEKLWLPFDDTTWTLLLLTFLFAFIAIFIINRLPKFFRKRFYGENIKTPALNVVSTFFGINLPQLPIRGMPRFILINFIFFCLIFQTCYQSKLFEFMTSQPRRSSLKTIQQLKDENYTLYHNLPAEYVDELIESDKDNWPTIQEISEQQYIDILQSQSQNASAKLGIIIQSMSLRLFELVTRTTLNWNEIPDYSFQVSQSGFAFLANNFFYENVDKATQQLTSTGIMDHFVEDCFPSERNAFSNDNWSVLTLDSLSFGFVIWLGFCGICSLSFIAEILYWIVKRKYEIIRKKACRTKIKQAKVHPIVGEIDEPLKNYPTDRSLFRVKVFVIEDLENDCDIIEFMSTEVLRLIQNEK